MPYLQAKLARMQGGCYRFSGHRQRIPRQYFGMARRWRAMNLPRLVVDDVQQPDAVNFAFRMPLKGPRAKLSQVSQLWFLGLHADEATLGLPWGTLAPTLPIYDLGFLCRCAADESNLPSTFPPTTSVSVSSACRPSCH